VTQSPCFKMSAAFVAIVLLICSFCHAQVGASPGASKAHITIILVGDSTVALEGGWGPGFCAHVSSDVACIDLAANGRSTKSFIDEGRWQKALDLRADFYFIQFGHNDQKLDSKLHTDPATTFSSNISRYVSEVKAIGGTPVLVTSLSRRNYQDGQLSMDPLSDYAAATRAVAAEQHVPLVDLYRLSTTLLRTMTQEQADRMDAPVHPDAKAVGRTQAAPDRTHLNDHGKKLFGQMVVEETRRQIPVLRSYLHIE